MSHKLQRADVVLGLAQQVGRLEPDLEFQFALSHHRSCDQAGLVPAVAALEVQHPSSPEVAVLAAPALGAYESLRPTLGLQFLLARLLRPVAPQELAQ